MDEDEARKIMESLLNKKVAEAIGLPSVPNRPTILRYANGRFESCEIDDAGNTIEPLARCPFCGPVIVCSEHLGF